MSGASDNKNKGCPALMSDGRHLSSWVSNQTLTDQMALSNGFSPNNLNSEEFRQFLINNASLIRAREQAEFRKVYSCPLPSKPIVVMKPYF